MSVMVQVQLPDDLKSAIDRQVAAGHAASEADYQKEAIRRYAEDLDAGEDLEAIALAGMADAEAGRYTLIETQADADRLHEQIMDRARASLSSDMT